MIKNVGYNDKINFCARGLNALNHFEGKYLKDSDGLVTGYFISPLKNGKNLLTEYKNGLLKSASLNKNGVISKKSYSYTADGKLINVKQNGEDIFVKDCGYVDSDTISYYETINDGKIELGYNSKNQKIAAVIKPKLLRSIFVRIGNTIREMRYKITNAETDGHHFFVYPCKNPKDDLYELETDLFKRIERNKATGSTTITTVEMKNTTKLVEKDKNGNIVSIVRTAFNKKTQPIWIIETDANENRLFERKINYDKNGDKIKEIFYDAKSQAVPYYQYRTYYKGEYILSSKLFDEDMKLQAVQHNTYNDYDKLVKSEIFNEKGKMLECETFKYDKNQNLLSSHYIGSDNDGLLEGYYRYKNGKPIYEKERYADCIEETVYNSDSNPIEYTIRDLKGKLIKSFKHTYNNGKLKKTECMDSSGNLYFTISHFIKQSDENKIHTKIFKDSNGKFIVKEKITYTDTDTKYDYYNKNGKAVPLSDYAQYIDY